MSIDETAWTWVDDLAQDSEDLDSLSDDSPAEPDTTTTAAPWWWTEGDRLGVDEGTTA